jgi:hypothetical protein
MAPPAQGDLGGQPCRAGHGMPPLTGLRLTGSPVGVEAPAEQIDQAERVGDGFRRIVFRIGAGLPDLSGGQPVRRR